MSGPALSTGTTIERYVLEAIIGQGGMATVYSARHTVLGSFHAVKIVNRSSKGWNSRILREGRAQAQLRHPNIVAVTDVLTFEERPVLVLEYVGGPPLHRLVEAFSLELEQVDDLARGILDGVGAAHGWGFVHRDLKPQNILCEVHGERLVPKITDFGLVRDYDGELLEPRTTRSGQLMGTPGYMAPEQIENARDVDQRADVFALGAVLYYLCTQVEPFINDNNTVRLRALMRGEVAPPRDLRPDLPPAWERAILRALDPDPDERTPDVATLKTQWAVGSATLTGEPTALWSSRLLRSASSLGPGVVAPRSSPTLEDASEIGLKRLGLADEASLEVFGSSDRKRKEPGAEKASIGSSWPPTPPHELTPGQLRGGAAEAGGRGAGLGPVSDRAEGTAVPPLDEMSLRELAQPTDSHVPIDDSSPSETWPVDPVDSDLRAWSDGSRGKAPWAGPGKGGVRGAEGSEPISLDRERSQPVRRRWPPVGLVVGLVAVVAVVCAVGLAGLKGEGTSAATSGARLGSAGSSGGGLSNSEQTLSEVGEGSEGDAVGGAEDGTASEVASSGRSGRTTSAGSSSAGSSQGGARDGAGSAGIPEVASGSSSESPASDGGGAGNGAGTARVDSEGGAAATASGSPSVGQAAPNSSLDVSGVTRAYLTDASGRQWSPGGVPPGTYTVWAFFDEANATRVMKVTIAQGESRQLSCSMGMRVCQ